MSEQTSQMRAEFEAWVQDCGCDTDGAWSAWQAAWNRRAGNGQAGEASGQDKAVSVGEHNGGDFDTRHRQEAVPAEVQALPLGFVKPDTDKQVFFYEQDFYVLSNFSAFRINWYGIDFDTSEAAYHWSKFNGRTDGILRHKIRCATSAHEAFKLAERNKAHRRADWDDVKVGIMLNILRAKADQHEYVHRKLLATGDRQLVEDSWRDDFWGWGPNRDGQNMLGKLWMEVRAELRAVNGIPLAAGVQKPDPVDPVSASSQGHTSQAKGEPK